MSWINKDSVEVLDNVNELTKEDIRTIFKDILNYYKYYKVFPWNKYYILVRLLPYINYITERQRKYLMQILSGQVLEKLEDYFIDEDEEEDIPFLFELKNVISTIWNSGYEAEYTMKCLDKKIQYLIKTYHSKKYGYLDMFFSNLEYPYTKESLKKCKLKIIKENHPDNGGSGEYIHGIQETYKLFMTYINKNK